MHLKPFFYLTLLNKEWFLMRVVMEEILIQIDFLASKEKGIRNKILLENAKNNLEEYHKIKNQVFE